MKKTRLLLSCIILSIVTAKAQYTYVYDTIQNNINKQLEIFPQERIHLHTDRDYYIPGEKIWFKAYVSDAVTHQFPTHSRYVYIELINSIDSLINRVMIRPDNEGMHHGHLFLSAMIPEGYYTLRAYTQYMNNLGDDYFFKKNIRIGKLPTENELKEEKKNRKKRAKINYDVSFFPEGGYLIEKSLCKIAFKALNQDGTSAYITGEIVNEHDSVITSVYTLHAGMGSFSFFPEKDEKYYLKCENENNLKKRFELPAVYADAYTLNVSSNKKNHFIAIKKNIKKTNQPLTLLIHSRGIVLYYETWDLKKEHLAFSKEQFPSGVIQIVLFDRHMNPLSERLVFNKNESYDQAKILFTTDKPNYQKREKVSTFLATESARETQTITNLSVAITDDKDMAVDSLNTILSSLLLSSELKGYIESPGYYLLNDKKAEAALDLLMMTHGWRRYDIPEVVKGNFLYPSQKYEVSQSFSGKVKSLFLRKPVIKSEVTLFTSNGYFEQTETDENGNFRFSGFELPDSTSYFIQSLGKKGSHRVELVMDHKPLPILKYAPYTPVLDYKEVDHAKTTSSNKEDDFIKKARQRAKYDENIRIIHLTEVEVTAKKIEKKDETRLKYWGNSSSDYTIYRERIEQRNPFYVSDMLNEVAGVQVSYNGAISIRRAGLPLILIDGVPMEWPDELLSKYDSPLEYIPVHAVESIDIFKGPGAAVFGVRGANGAISITTRRGDSDYFVKKNFNYISLSPLGYQEAAEFYAPKYDTPESQHLGNPDYRTTIFWKPDITISGKDKASFEFYTSDFPSTYSVVIEGLTSDGKIIRQIEKIEVK